MARTAVATDNFNRANGGLGANWTQLNPLQSSINIASNVIGSDATFKGAARWDGAGSFNDDQYGSTVFVVTNFGVSTYGIGAIARATSDVDGARDYYYFYGGSNNTYVLGKVVNGTNTDLATGAQTWSSNDRVEIECEGTTIRGMRNGSTLATVTDSDLTTGKPGVMASGDGFAATGDDWEGGSLGGVTLDEDGEWIIPTQSW